jgi:exopolysaccharide biosynthesis polyprenyl glycosylphosphotransferase
MATEQATPYVPDARPERPAFRLLGARQQYNRLYVLVALSDAASVVGGFALAAFIRSPVNRRVALSGPMLALLPILVIAVFSSLRLYQVHQLSSAEEFRRLGHAVTATVVISMAVLIWRPLPFDRSAFLIVWPASLLLVLTSRRLWRQYIRNARRRGSLTFRTVIVGTGPEAERLRETLLETTLGFEALGFVATDHSRGLGSRNLPVLGHVRDIRTLIDEIAADCIFVTATAVGTDDMKYVSKAVRLDGIELRFTVNLPEVKTNRVAVLPVGRAMTLSLAPVQLTGPQTGLKRIFDICAASLGVLVLLPVFALIAIAIKGTSKGSVLYRQARVGHRGRRFVMYKFRSMVSDAESMLALVREENEASAPLFKIKNDPRETSVGRFLRRASLDELPQLFNVIKGEMSLVGPRPALESELGSYKEWHFDRLEMRPGITGLWQITRNGVWSFDDCVRLDLFYIENWSLSYDLFVILKTIPTVVSMRGGW